MINDHFSKSGSNPSPPVRPTLHIGMDIQPDGGYTKRVVTPFGTTRLKRGGGVLYAKGSYTRDFTVIPECLQFVLVRVGNSARKRCQEGGDPTPASLRACDTYMKLLSACSCWCARCASRRRRVGNAASHNSQMCVHGRSCSFRCELRL